MQEPNATHADAGEPEPEPEPEHGACATNGDEKEEVLL